MNLDVNNFFGTYTPRLDDKFRLFLPAQVPPAPRAGVVLSPGQENCIYGWTPEAFTAFTDRMPRYPVHQPGGPQVRAHGLRAAPRRGARQAGTDLRSRRCSASGPRSSARSRSSGRWTASRSGTPAAGRSSSQRRGTLRRHVRRGDARHLLTVTAWPDTRPSGSDITSPVSEPNGRGSGHTANRSHRHRPGDTNQERPWRPRDGCGTTSPTPSCSWCSPWACRSASPWPSHSWRGCDDWADDWAIAGVEPRPGPARARPRAARSLLRPRPAGRRGRDPRAGRPCRGDAHPLRRPPPHRHRP